MIKILDASSFIHGYNPSVEDGEHYTTYGIIKEVKTKKEVVELAIEYGKLRIREPKTETVEKVKKMSIKTGDTLSKNDMDILALAMDLNGILYTDDYGLQNVAKRLNVKVKCIVSEGIKERFTWKLVCKGCKKMYDIDYFDEVCEICGSPLERKMVKNRYKNKKKRCKK
ncbi:type II toxin-antitoxin system VapC family toxin [Methanothermococcus sp.]|uniref:type II toxin-antitoxin system VapC family toxin n=1 Tax=Methanothermococcus sp. TaxID=2614238 RepID=UPI0025F33812|nr:type II toxin-antitoxin system VapC family toxin [Methanothermococcus sp.]